MSIDALKTIDINDPDTLDQVNAWLEATTEGTFHTPYVALERVRKVLGSVHIAIPATYFLVDNPISVWEVHQFGEQSGVDEKGEQITTPEATLFIYFEYDMNEDGYYTTFATLATADELDDLLDAYEADEDHSQEDETDD